jgi:hypothetical protein
MKFAIMFENSPRWGNTDSKDLIENLMPFWMETYFKRENYLVIDNKPELFVYYQPQMTKVWPNPADQKAAFDACREYARRFGFDGMLFGVCKISGDKEVYDDLKARGYDLRFGYTAGYNSPCDFFSDEEAIIEGQLDNMRRELSFDPAGFIPTASCFWDPTPRFGKRWVDLGYDFRSAWNIWYLSPEGFRDLLEKMKKECDALPEGAFAQKILMIDNWNEWDEGHFIAPSHKYGYKFLQAVREEFTERENLPDYRTPQDMGLSKNLNKSWEEPDFTEVCKKLLENK